LRPFFTHQRKYNESNISSTKHHRHHLINLSHCRIFCVGRLYNTELQMTTQEKIEILRSAKTNTVWGYAVQNRLDRDLADVIESLRSQWEDSPNVLQSCFSKSLKPLFDGNTH